MNDKVTLIGPNGEKEERKVVCYFKSVDESHPNIKDIPILIVDTEQKNNGNNVLSFYWEKDGLYQPILDDAAWSEVKTVLINIIKKNYEVVGVN